MPTFATSKTEGGALPAAPRAVTPCPHCAKQTLVRRGKSEDITPPDGHPGHHHTLPATWRWTTSLLPDRGPGMFEDPRRCSCGSPAYGLTDTVCLEHAATKYEMGDVGQERLRPFLDAVAQRVSTCKLCSAPMWWVPATWSGKTPTVYAFGKPPEAPANVKLHPFSANGVSHFADCPRAAEARKRGGA